MSTVIITISKRSYSTRGRALGIAKQAISREMNVLTNANGDSLFWTLDNVVVEEAEDGWRWHVEIDMPSTDSAMAEIEAQEEAPRELTVEQALEIAAQHTEAVDEEFNAVEARHRAEAEQKSEMDKVKDMTRMELSIAASTGKGTLAETIDRMETTLKHLKEYQREYKAGDPKEDAFYMAERLRRASNEIHGYFCTSLAMELATTAGSLEQLAKAVCRLGMDGE